MYTVDYLCLSFFWQHRCSGLRSVVDRAAAAVNSRLMSIMRTRFGIRKHCLALKKYLLLGQGDFVTRLLVNNNNNINNSNNDNEDRDDSSTILERGGGGRKEGRKESEISIHLSHTHLINTLLCSRTCTPRRCTGKSRRRRRQGTCPR